MTYREETIGSARQAREGKSEEIMDPATARDKLVSLASEAWRRWPGAAMAGARRDHVHRAIARELVFVAMESWQRGSQASFLGWILEEGRLEAEEGLVEGLAGIGAIPRRKIDHLRAAITDAANRTREFDHRHPDRVVRKTVERHASVAAGRAAKEIAAKRINRLHTFLLDGKSLAQCTAREALAWADRCEAEAAWIRALCQNVPLDETLGQWYDSSALTVEEIWAAENSPEAAERREALRLLASSAWEEADRCGKAIGPFGMELVRLARKRVRANRLRMADPKSIVALPV